MKRIFTLIAIIGVILGCSNNNENEEYVNILEADKTELSAISGGEITKITVNEGDKVEKGELIAVIDTTKIELELEALKTKVEEVMVGIDLAEEKLKIAEQDMKYLKDKFERIKKLYKAGSATRQKFDDIKNKYDKTLNNINIQRLNIEKMNSSLKNLVVQKKILKNKIEDAKIKSPSGGLVNDLFYKKGEALPAFRPIAEIVEIETLEVNVYLSAAELQSIRIGDGAIITIDNNPKIFNGKIVHIGNKAEFTPKEILTPETRSSLVYSVTIEIQNKDYILKDGMPVKVDL